MALDRTEHYAHAAELEVLQLLAARLRDASRDCFCRCCEAPDDFPAVVDCLRLDQAVLVLMTRTLNQLYERLDKLVPKSKSVPVKEGLSVLAKQSCQVRHEVE